MPIALGDRITEPLVGGLVGYVSSFNFFSLYALSG
jgi:hypothetical protein